MLRTVGSSLARLVIVLASLAPDGQGQPSLPRFEDYAVQEAWSGPVAPVRLVTHSERMFRTNLTNAAKEAPNFEGHYRITFWGCGSVCSAGAMIDLKSGSVHPLPQHVGSTGWGRWNDCAASFENTGTDFRLNSRLIVDRCGMNTDDNGVNHPDTFYSVWEGTRFRLLAHVEAPRFSK